MQKDEIKLANFNKEISDMEDFNTIEIEGNTPNNENKKKTEKSVEALMGKKPELRFKFIQENSKKVAAENVL